MTCAFCGSSKAQLRTDLLMVQCVNRSECRKRQEAKAPPGDERTLLRFELLWGTHPKAGRVKKRNAFAAYSYCMRSGDSASDIRAAHANYLRMLARPENSWRHPQNMDTWIRNWRDWKPEPAPVPEPEDTRSPVRRVAEDLVYPWIRANGVPEDDPELRARFNEEFDREISWPDGYVDRWHRYVTVCLFEFVPPIPEEVTIAKA